MSTRRLRFACIFMLSLLLADTLLAACSGGASVRRTREDAWLLSIAGYYQLTGEQPPTALAGSLKMARLAEAHVRPQESTNSNEVWTLIGYYVGLRDRYEQEGRAKGLSDDEIEKLLAGINAKIDDLMAKAKALDARRARHRGTAWKRFFDGLGRGVGRAFDVGGKVAKFVIEDVPGTVVTYAPAIIKELAQQYVEKLKETAKGRLFDLLAKKAPGVVTAYLVYELGRKGLQIAREVERQLGRHGGGAAQDAPAASEDGATSSNETGGAFALPASGTWAATCDSGRDDSVEAWCEEQGGQLSTDPAFKLTIDFASGTFSFAAKTECVGPKFTNSSSGWTQNTTSEEIQGGGTLYADGWLVGTAKVKALWIEEGVRVKAAGSESYKEGGPTEGTIPLIAYLDGEEDLRALDLYFTSGAYGEVDPVSIEWLREIGWDGVVDWLKGCEACYTVCRPGGEP